MHALTAARRVRDFLLFFKCYRCVSERAIAIMSLDCFEERLLTRVGSGPNASAGQQQSACTAARLSCFLYDDNLQLLRVEVRMSKEVRSQVARLETHAKELSEHVEVSFFLELLRHIFGLSLCACVRLVQLAISIFTLRTYSQHLCRIPALNRRCELQLVKGHRLTLTVRACPQHLQDASLTITVRSCLQCVQDYRLTLICEHAISTDWLSGDC